jgi:hypothetical protein
MTIEFGAFFASGLVAFWQMLAVAWRTLSGGL